MSVNRPHSGQCSADVHDVCVCVKIHCTLFLHDILQDMCQTLFGSRSCLRTLARKGAKILCSSSVL